MALGKIEHLGIAVANLEASEILFQKLLGTAPYKRERVDSEGVETSFFQVGLNKIELLAATHPNSPIQQFLEKNGEGIHHVAFHVDNLQEEIQRLQKEGFIILNDPPKLGADGKLIAFLHPKTTGRVLVELCQDLPQP